MKPYWWPRTDREGTVFFMGLVGGGAAMAVAFSLGLAIAGWVG